MQVPNACMYLHSVDTKKLNLECATENKIGPAGGFPAGERKSLRRQWVGMLSSDTFLMAVNSVSGRRGMEIS